MDIAKKQKNSCRIKKGGNCIHSRMTQKEKKLKRKIVAG